jgi:putative tryptophan/tyrosine transport system substrate-binding protein
MPLVGALCPGRPDASIIVSGRDALARGLRAEGYVEGQNIVVEENYGVNAEELASAANEIVGLRSDVIVAGGTPAALAAKHATGTIPIVVHNLADPVGDGLAASLSRSGGNVTDNTFIGPELGPKRLQLLRELLPGISRFAALRHPGVYSERTMQAMLTEMQAAAAKIGIAFQVFIAAGPDDFDEAFDAMIKAREDALVVFPSPMFYVNYRRLVDLATAHRLPTMYVFKEAVQAGGLMSYGPDIIGQVRLAARYVARILRGANPAELPIEQPTKFELVINLKTAKELGLTVPPSLLVFAGGTSGLGCSVSQVSTLLSPAC